MSRRRVDAAMDQARRDRSATAPPPTHGGRFSRSVAIGDPQAPIERFLAILDDHGLLGEDGHLAADVRLVSMGDHFDWGDRADREDAAESGLLALSWLAAHPADQVILVAGNHDLARVSELVHFDDERFEEAQREADAAYYDRMPLRSEAAFCAVYGVPSWEVVARDFSSFRAEQRELVARLLRAGRLRLAYAPAPDLLLTHCGVTVDDLASVGIFQSGDATVLARELGDLLEAAVRTWSGDEPFAIPGWHAPGSAGREGVGALYHRPASWALGGGMPPPAAETSLRRRYDPRRLPKGIVQGIGHIRDKKSRELLGLDVGAAEDGVLRHLVTDGVRVEYARGVPDGLAGDVAAIVFLDGGMNHCDPARYELFDLDERVAAGRVGSGGGIALMKLPGVDRAVVDVPKVRDYLLSHAHPIGRLKAAFFAALGYSSLEWERLHDDILAVARDGEATPGHTSDYGQKYEICGIVRGPSGRAARLVTVWIILKGDETPRFVTAFPGERS